MNARGKAKNLPFHKQPKPSAMVVLQMHPVVLRLALNAGGAGGLRVDSCRAGGPDLRRGS